MTLLNIMAVLVTLAALFSYVNHRFIGLPTTIGLMLIALVMSLALLAAGELGWAGVREEALQVLRSIDFHEALMQGMLSFLLFAGALHVNVNELAEQKGTITVLASVGVLLSTFIVGGLAWLTLNMLGHNMPIVYCLLFGALISPTDPIAVLGILKTVGAPKSLEVKIAGESLFNDGIGVVVFLVLLGIAAGGHDVSAGGIALLFVQEAIGGLVFGLAIGALAYYLLKSIDNYQVEILITLALVSGGYALANALHISGPIAVVVAGLLVGNHGRRLAMSAKTREHLDTFWELVDDILNAVLFVLIGLEVLVLHFAVEYLLAALVIIPVVLLARFISVGAPLLLLRRYRAFSPNAVQIMTWGGLRGAISVALALSLPLGMERDVIVAITYIVVVFSVAVQGLTVGSLIRGR